MDEDLEKANKKWIAAEWEADAAHEAVQKAVDACLDSASWKDWESARNQLREAVGAEFRTEKARRKAWSEYERAKYQHEEAA